MDVHHLAWLSVHPERTQGWLSAQLVDGFDVHHLDGDHANNAPENLVLIEHRDHMALHGGSTAGRLRKVKSKQGRCGAHRLTNAKVRKAIEEYAQGRASLAAIMAEVPDAHRP